VYQKDLGPDTLKGSANLVQIQPDKTWPPTNDNGEPFLYMFRLKVRSGKRRKLECKNVTVLAYVLLALGFVLLGVLV